MSSKSSTLISLEDKSTVIEKQPDERSDIGRFENNVLFRYLPEERKKELKK